MSAKEDLHGGHRERLKEKFINNPESFSEHEILELLLFNFIPRKNTNDIAHRLLRRFDGIKNVLCASYVDLISIDGIGKKTAESILLLGKIINKVNEIPEKEPERWSNFKSYSEYLISRFKAKEKEEISFYFLNKNSVMYHHLDFSDGETLKVVADLPELLREIAIFKPDSVVVAHNHPSGKCGPSKDDDESTVKLALLCAVQGCVLKDHVIVSGCLAYSYRLERRLDDLLINADLNKTYAALKPQILPSDIFSEED